MNENEWVEHFLSRWNHFVCVLNFFDGCKNRFAPQSNRLKNNFDHFYTFRLWTSVLCFHKKWHLSVRMEKLRKLSIWFEVCDADTFCESIDLRPKSISLWANWTKEREIDIDLIGNWSPMDTWKNFIKKVWITLFFPGNPNDQTVFINRPLNYVEY